MATKEGKYIRGLSSLFLNIRSLQSSYWQILCNNYYVKVHVIHVLVLKEQTISIHFAQYLAVFRIRIRIRIYMFLGLPDPDPLIRGVDPDPVHSSIINQK
jgi:hypothetical protein